MSYLVALSLINKDSFGEGKTINDSRNMAGKKIYDLKDLVNDSKAVTTVSHLIISRSNY